MNVQYSIHADNIRWLKKNASEHTIMSEGIISSLAEEMKKDGIPSPAEAYRIFSSLSGDNTDSGMFALLCRHLNDSNGYVLESVDVPKMTTYLRVPAADKAFAHFSKLYKGLGASYSTDFKSACEDVYYDRVDSCILPLESSSDGLSSAFRHMMLKYELKITSAVKIVTNEDSYQIMALLTGGFTDPLGDICEICLPGLSPHKLYEAIRVFEVFSAEVIRITSIPSRLGDSHDQHVCIKVSPEAVPSLRYTLDGLYPANILLGQYKKY